MELKYRLTIERALGIIEGVSTGCDIAVSDMLTVAIEMINGVMEEMGGDNDG